MVLISRTTPATLLMSGFAACLEHPLHISGLAQRYALLGESADHDEVSIWIP